jgi:hypothetical protein
MCVTALSSSPEGRALAGSFRYGILFLLVVPYLIVGLHRLCYLSRLPKAAAAARTQKVL